MSCRLKGAYHRQGEARHPKDLAALMCASGLRPHQLLHLRRDWADLLAKRFNIGALIFRMGFGAHDTMVIVRNPQYSVSNY